MPRVFAHYRVTFRRTVVQTQVVNVAVPPEIDDLTKVAVAKQLAAPRVKEAGWEMTEIDGVPPLVEIDSAVPEMGSVQKPKKSKVVA